MSVRSETVELVGEEAATNLARTVVFAAAAAATAPVTITHPLAPGIPITLQTLWVYLAGLVLGPVWGAAAFALYTVAGALGLPVFAGGAAGVGVLTSNTGGYIFGFVAGAFVVGLLAHGPTGLRDPRDLGFVRPVVALVAGTATIYAFGVAGLMVFVDLGLRTAVEVGVLPFLTVAAVKVAAAVGVVNADRVPWGDVVTR